MKSSIKHLGQALVQAGKGFVKDKVPKLSASLAYYTLFSLGPMMVVIITLADLFWGRQAVEGAVYDQLKELIGGGAASQIQEIIRNASISGGTNVAAAIGFITLFIGATTVFGEIQDSVNQIWKLRVKTDRGWLKMILNRLLSFSLVISLGFLLIVSLLINTLISVFMEKLESIFPDVTVIVFYVLNQIITLAITWFLFAIIFKVLPDAVIRWKHVGAGALFTALLFILGKFGISFYLGRSDIGSTYGAAGSLVVLLLWVYYSSIILYFGAEFTKAYAVIHGEEIRPNHYAVTVQLVEIESGKRNVQENEKEADRIAEKLQKAADESAT